MKNVRLRALTEGAILIALAEILSFLPFYKLPWGGSIDFAMLPILLFCCRWGFGPGMLVSVTHAILQTLFEGGIAIGWQSIVGDFLPHKFVRPVLVVVFAFSVVRIGVNIAVLVNQHNRFASFHSLCDFIVVVG